MLFGNPILYSKLSLTPRKSTHGGMVLPFAQMHCKLMINDLKLLVIWKFLQLSLWHNTFIEDPVYNTEPYSLQL